MSRVSSGQSLFVISALHLYIVCFTHDLLMSLCKLGGFGGFFLFVSLVSFGLYFSDICCSSLRCINYSCFISVSCKFGEFGCFRSVRVVSSVLSLSLMSFVVLRSIIDSLLDVQIIASLTF